jgi:hypothetical protein
LTVVESKAEPIPTKGGWLSSIGFGKIKGVFNPNSLSSGIAWSVEYLMQRAKQKAFMELLHHS